jgi:predicted nuclease of predicted toxin-antitoxin system
MKFLIDMGLSPEWRETFEAHGFEAEHWSEVGSPKAKDREILSWAREHGFIVFTHDLDFGHLLALTHAAGPSVIQVRSEEVLPSRIGPLVLRALRQHCDLLESGALVVIEPANFRVRILPI